MIDAPAPVRADPDLVAMLVDVFGAECSGDDVRAAEVEQVLPRRMLDALVDAGLSHIGIAEQFGGPGGTTADAAAVIRAAGRHACPVPLAEQALTAGWLLGSAGLAVPEGPYVVATDADLTSARGLVGGTVRRVPWMRQISTVVGFADQGAHVVVLDVSGLPVEQGSSLAGEPRDGLVLDSAPAAAIASAGGATPTELRERAAATRVMLMAGACESILASTVRYAAERHQFGKPINTFQAVATHLAVMVEQTAMACAAADLAAAAIGTSRLGVEVAAAKIVVGESASKVAKSAHQVYGAMGVTAECDLQLFTRRIWTWRDEHGSEAFWSRALGQRVLAAGPDGAWDLVCEPMGGTA
jgi:alkylation response protein AidB-like acyl-CoA dehydrogenase